MRPIIILGASGFIGNTLYKELAPYYKTYGTYNSSVEKLKYIYIDIADRNF